MARLSNGCRQWQAIWWRTRGCRSPVVSGVSSLPTAVGTRLPSLALLSSESCMGAQGSTPRKPQTRRMTASRWSCSSSEVNKRMFERQKQAKYRSSCRA